MLLRHHRPTQEINEDNTGKTAPTSNVSTDTSQQGMLANRQIKKISDLASARLNLTPFTL